MSTTNTTARHKNTTEETTMIIIIVAWLKDELLPNYLVNVIENDGRYYDENRLLAIDYFSMDYINKYCYCYYICYKLYIN